MTEKMELEDAISAAAVTKELQRQAILTFVAYNVAMKTLWPAPTEQSPLFFFGGGGGGKEQVLYGQLTRLSRFCGESLAT